MYVALHGRSVPGECVITRPTALGGGKPGHTLVPPTHDEGAHMDAFTAGLLQRIRTTQSDLTRARETGDDFLADVEQGELDDLHRLAAEHGVEIGATAV